jgi:hypothetical protein
MQGSVFLFLIFLLFLVYFCCYPHPGNNATCVQEGAAVAAAQQGNQTTPVKLTEAGITSETTQNQLIACLLQAGIVFT